MIDNDEVDDNHFIVNPIVCSLTPNQLECFIHHIHPISLATPILALKDIYYTALTSLPIIFFKISIEGIETFSSRQEFFLKK